MQNVAQFLPKIRRLEALGIEFMIEKTSETVIKCNEIHKDKKAVAALHLTC